MVGLAGRIDAVVVCGGQGHDFDYVRHELLGELLGHDVVRTTVYPDFHALDAIAAADFVVSYTCNVVPAPEEQAALVDFVRNGGRWLALHATNATLASADRPGVYYAPDTLGALKDLLGGRFVAHPPIGPVNVEVTAPNHPLVSGLKAFVARDELYVLEVSEPVEVLLHTSFGGRCENFEPPDYAYEERRPVLYLKPTGSGTVCYLTLGHTCGRFDMQIVGIDDLGSSDFGSWNIPEFREILRRCLTWAITGAF